MYNLYDNFLIKEEEISSFKNVRIFHKRLIGGKLKLSLVSPSTIDAYNKIYYANYASGGKWQIQNIICFLDGSFGDDLLLNYLKEEYPAEFV